MFFIHHANTTDVLNLLSAAITSHRIVPFYGCAGSGKSWLLGYLATAFWQRESGRQGRIPRVAYVELWEPRTKSGALSTPAARMTFTEIVLGMAQISRRYDSPFVYENRLWYRKDRKESEDKQFASLFAFVRDEVRRLNIDTLLIDNASHLDLFTLQKLMEVRRFKNHELGLIFCASIERQGQINESTSRLLATVIDELEREQKVELFPTTDTEVMTSILIKLLAEHRIGFSRDLTKQDVTYMRKMFWDDTQGDWTAIAVRERRMKDILGPNKGIMRYITKERWEQIMGKTLPNI